MRPRNTSRDRAQWGHRYFSQPNTCVTETQQCVVMVTSLEFVVVGWAGQTSNCAPGNAFVSESLSGGRQVCMTAVCLLSLVCGGCQRHTLPRFMQLSSSWNQHCRSLRVVKACGVVGLGWHLRSARACNPQGVVLDVQRQRDRRCISHCSASARLT